MKTSFRVSYADAKDGASLICTTINRWTRENAPTMIMSASSGPKDYVKNQVAAAFAARPNLEALAIVIANGPMFSLFKEGGHWRDASGRAVRIEVIA